MGSDQFPRLTFGLIVLNGQPFIRYNLRALYPFAYQIIVVEGAVPGAAEVATVDGHSRDGSLEELYRFQAQEDPQQKIEIVTKDGFWSEKDEMSQAYAARVKGDFLWQVDIDEFYQPQDMQKIVSMLRVDRDLTAVYFKQISFWGGFDYVSDGWYLRQAQDQGPGIVPRLFRWRPGYCYAAHRPVVVLDEVGDDIRKIKPLNGQELAAQAIYMYHYALVFPKQVAEKSAYYSEAGWVRRKQMNEWAENVYHDLRRPYRVHNVYHYPSWLEHFRGDHPPQIEALRRDIVAGEVAIDLRPTSDIETLLNKRSYRIGRSCYKLVDPIARRVILMRRKMRARRTAGENTPR